MTTDEFNKIVTDWLSTALHPKYQRPYTECVYQPMAEPLAYLRAPGLRSSVVGEDACRLEGRAYGCRPAIRTDKLISEK